MKKIQPDFTKDAIAETLLLTVALRAFDARQKRPVLGDKKSAQLMERIDYDFQQFAKSSMMSRLGTNVRGKYFDACAREFIAAHDQPIIVLLGCGLDTRYHRLDGDSKTVFYELDLPEVITLREKLLPETGSALTFSVSGPAKNQNATVHYGKCRLFSNGGLMMNRSLSDGIPLIHHQKVTCGVSCGSIRLRRIQIRLRVLLPCYLASGILLVARK